jgi:hypothetical protein
LLQVWWLENDILTVHHHLKNAHGELIAAMQGMENVKSTSLRSCHRMENR